MPSKNRSVNLYMDDVLFESVDDIARKYKRPRTWVLRLALQGELQKRTNDRYTEEQFSVLRERLNGLTERIGKAQRELNRIGKNVNQIAKAANQSPHNMEKVDALKESVEALNRLELYLDAIAKVVTERLW